MTNKQNKFIDEAFASIVVLIRQFHSLDDEQKKKNMHVTSCSYHLHFLVSKAEDDISVVCLDNSDFISAKGLNLYKQKDKNNQDAIEAWVDKIIKMMVKDWNEKELNYYYNGVELIKTVQNQSKVQEYWNKFNEIKQQTYAEDLKKYLDYVSNYKNEAMASTILKDTLQDALEIIWSKSEDGFETVATKNEEHYQFSK